jgi:ankyrin repeat protein
MLERPDVNPSANDYEAFRLASAYGHSDIVRLFLERSDVNPGAHDNDAIRLASVFGNTDVVRILLKRSDIHPGAQDNEALINAAKHGYTDILKLLLDDSRTDPSAQFNLPFRWATYNGRVGSVKLLLADKRVNPADQNNAAILSLLNPALKQRNKILKLLLEDGRADPSVNNNQILYGLRNAESLSANEILKRDDRVKAIEFLNSGIKRLSTTTFLNLFNSHLKWSTVSYVEGVFSNDLVASFISDLLQISIKEAKAIHNLDDFDKYMYIIHKEMTRNTKHISLEWKIEFLWKYYGATLGYKDHFPRFQELTIYMLKN